MSMPLIDTLLRGDGKIPSLIICTDVGRDQDDELAIITAIALKKRGLVDVRAIICSLKPAIMRARLALGILHSLGVYDVPVGVGSEIKTDLEVQPFEFDAEYLSSIETYPSAMELLQEAFSNVEDRSLTYLSITALTDLHHFLQAHPSLAKSKLKTLVHMGNAVYNPGLACLVPCSAYNNDLDLNAARGAFDFCQAFSVPLRIVTRHVAMACAVSVSFFNLLRDTGHAIGRRLHRNQSTSLLHLWGQVERGQGELPARCTVEWFLLTYTQLSLREYEERGVEDMWAQIVRMNVYDVITLLCCWEETGAMEGGRVFVPVGYAVHGEKGQVVHEVVGLSAVESGVKQAGAEVVREVLGKLVGEVLRDNL